MSVENLSFEEHWSERARESLSEAQSKSPEVDTIIQFVKELCPEKILEIGCNYGRELKHLEGFALLHGIDSNQDMVSRARTHVSGDFSLGDAICLPYSDNSFDLVYTDGLLSHLPPEKVGEAIKEALRVSSKFVLLVEYLGTRQSRNNFSNCKRFTWVHDYERLIATFDAVIKYKQKVFFGTDCYQIILMSKTQWFTKVITSKSFVKVAPEYKIKIGRFKISW